MPPVRVDASGEHGPTPWQVRSSRWRRTTRGLYVPADVERTTEQRIVEAAAVLGGGEAVTRWAALHWQHARWFGGLTGDGSELPVPLLVHRHLLPQPGVSYSQESPRGEHTDLDGLTITPALRSVSFEVRYAGTVRAAVRVIDMAAYDDLVSLDELRDEVVRYGAWTGDCVRRCRSPTRTPGLRPSATCEWSGWSPDWAVR